MPNTAGVTDVQPAAGVQMIGVEARLGLHTAAATESDFDDAAARGQ
jgi:hypothetical protein